MCKSRHPTVAPQLTLEFLERNDKGSWCGCFLFLYESGTHIICLKFVFVLG